MNSAFPLAIRMREMKNRSLLQFLFEPSSIYVNWLFHYGLRVFLPFFRERNDGERLNERDGIDRTCRENKSV